MGCCIRKTKKLKKFKDNKIEFADKKSQLNKLHDILKKINEEIDKLKQTKENTGEVIKRSCYLAQMTIAIRWIIRMVEVNHEV